MFRLRTVLALTFLLAIAFAFTSENPVSTFFSSPPSSPPSSAPPGVEPDAILYISPTNTDVKEGETFVLTVGLESSNLPVDAVGAFLNFDPTRMRVLNVVSTVSQLNYFDVSFSNARGEINIGGTLPNSVIPGRVEFAEIEMVALSEGGSLVTFSNQADRVSYLSNSGFTVLDRFLNALVFVQPSMEPSSADIFVSLDFGGASVNLDNAQREQLPPIQSSDIIVYNETEASWSLFFDGSNFGLDNANIDGFHNYSQGLLISFDAPTAVPGISQTIEPEDIVLFVPNNASYDSGQFIFAFDGSDVGLAGFNVDGISISPSGTLLVSTNEDLFFSAGSTNKIVAEFIATSFGPQTSGSWDVYLDGSDIGLFIGFTEMVGIDAATNGELSFTTSEDWLVDNLNIDENDIATCKLGTLGQSTTCSVIIERLEGDFVGIRNQTISGIDIVSTNFNEQPILKNLDELVAD